MRERRAERIPKDITEDFTHLAMVKVPTQRKVSRNTKTQKEEERRNIQVARKRKKLKYTGRTSRLLSDLSIYI